MVESALGKDLIVCPNPDRKGEFQVIRGQAETWILCYNLSLQTGPGQARRVLGLERP